MFPTNIHTLKIRETNLDPYFSNKKVEYISLDESIEIRILVAQSNQPKSPQGLSKKLVKRILCYYIEKENNYIIALRKKMIILLYKKRK